ncbi:MAG: M48 family metallopeptidase [Clostridia bacterium]
MQGVKYQVVAKKYPGKNPRVFFRNERFEIYMNNALNLESGMTAIDEAFGSWFNKRAEEVFSERLKYYCGIIGVKYHRFCIKAQKTRWGSCSSKGNLNFNWRLVMAPEWVLDYVVVHELAHLKHMNHSKEFWDTVAIYIPEYKKAVAWLKENGGTLKPQFVKEEVL